MRSKRELQKQIEKCEEAIEEYKGAMKRLEKEQDNPLIEIGQRNMNFHLIRDCQNYIKQYERNIHMLEHEMAHPPKEPVKLYDSLWEQVRSGEPVRAGRLLSPVVNEQ
ncbi:hypothetical protein COK09_27665 [Bacillus cereus]|uniref:hypothetical protein n=1 Tax=Bacillus wiedmannii TaxID=1890302 RepID=UPI000BF40CA6|nr:hypothetical protein [Bacillus wiedmannii]PFP51385.1 hypothetical protein COK09_27665 [Bacillus cereus]PFY93017.1 hypothetical protein COL57_26475 [Bacillus wiedmannii]PGZ13565.1 hypothetical protein COE43_21080 [Bacillus cereus]